MPGASAASWQDDVVSVMLNGPDVFEDLIGILLQGLLRHSKAGGGSEMGERCVQKGGAKLRWTLKASRVHFP